MDRGYIDFERLGRFHAAGSSFVIRGKRNLKAKRRAEAKARPELKGTRYVWLKNQDNLPSSGKESQ